MSDEDKQLDQEWLDAISEEYEDVELGPDEEKDEESETDETSSEDDGSHEDKEEEDGAEELDEDNGAEDSDNGNDSEDESDQVSSEDAESSEQKTAEEAEQPPKPLTAEEIKAALLEIEQEKAFKTESLNTLKDEVLESLYPEGIDRQLRDADGDPINGIQDLTGVDPMTGKVVGEGLINPVTGEVFTEEEAGRFILRGQQRLNEQIELMENQAYSIAEAQLSLKESSERVEQEYGEILNSLPEAVNKQIADAYIKTLRRDPKSGIVIAAPLDAYEFYSIALAGVKTMQSPQPAQPQPKPQPKVETPKPKPSGEDRADLSRRGEPTSLKGEEAEWAEAFKEVLGK